MFGSSSSLLFIDLNFFVRIVYSNKIILENCFVSSFKRYLKNYLKFLIKCEKMTLLIYKSIIFFDVCKFKFCMLNCILQKMAFSDYLSFLETLSL